MSVTQFWNAMHIVNTTGTSLAIPVQADGYKQLFSPSSSMCNVPGGSTSDSYTLNVCAHSTVVLGAGIYRNDDFDQSVTLNFQGYGVLIFDDSNAVNGSDIDQRVRWEGSDKVAAPTGCNWNFNHNGNLVVTLTIS